MFKNFFMLVNNRESCLLIGDIQDRYFLHLADEHLSLQVYLGEQYVNSSTLSDVTFLVEG